jgi:hypothetical protein
MELVAGTISEEVLVHDSVKEDGVGFTSEDQLSAGALAGHVEPLVAIILGGLRLDPSCLVSRHAMKLGKQAANPVVVHL